MEKKWIEYLPYSFMKELGTLIKEYKDGDETPLDGREIERLADIIKVKIHLYEGNITEAEYDKLLDVRRVEI